MLEEGKHIIRYFLLKAGEEAAKGVDDIETTWGAVLQQEEWQLRMGGSS